MARGHVGIVVGIQSGLSGLFDLWSRMLRAEQLTAEEVERVQLIEHLISFKKLCDQSGVMTSIALPNSDHLSNLSQFFHFIGQPLKTKDAVRLEAIQNLPVKCFFYMAIDLTPSRFVEQLARMTLLCPKVDHVVMGKEPVWNHKSLVALKESWKWIEPTNEIDWNDFLKSVTGRDLKDTLAELKKDPLVSTRNLRMKKVLDQIEKASEVSGPIVIVGEAGTGKDLAIKRLQMLSKPEGEVLVIENAEEISPESIPLLVEKVTMNATTKIILSFEGYPDDEGPMAELLQLMQIQPIELPPLRHRREDLELLADFFIRKYNIEKRRKVTGISKRALRALAGYDWPGNINELALLMEKSVSHKASGMMDVCDFPEKYVQSILSEIEYEDILRGTNKRLAPPVTLPKKEACYDQKYGEDFTMTNNFFKGHIEQMASGHACDENCAHDTSEAAKAGTAKMEEFLEALQTSFKCTDEGVDFNTIVDRFENILILAALARTGWNRNRAAALLKLNRTTLVEKLKKKQLAQPGVPAGSATAPVSF